MTIPSKYHSDAKLRKEIMKYKKEVLKDYISASKELSKACKSIMSEFISTQKPTLKPNKNKNKGVGVPVPPPPPAPPPPAPPPPPQLKLPIKNSFVKLNKNKRNGPKASSGLPFMNQLKNAIKNKKKKANEGSIQTNGKGKK